MLPRKTKSERFAVAIVLACLIVGSASAESVKDWQDTIWHQWAEKYPDWIAPMEPFKIIDRVYYVGTQGISAYLIQGDDGHILLDGGLPQSAEQIADNIKSLGFTLTDVKILINSHAHFDHSGGLNELKKLTGAKMIASDQDAVWLENGRYPGEADSHLNSIPVVVDRIIADGEELVLGSTRLSAHINPGHSPGCTSWKMQADVADNSYKVLFFCGASVAGNRLFPDPHYPGIIEDYRKTLSIIQNWQVDVFLSNHPFYFDLQGKRKAQLAGNDAAFIDSDEFSIAAVKMQESFEKKLAQQKAESLKATSK